MMAKNQKGGTKTSTHRFTMLEKRQNHKNAGKIIKTNSQNYEIAVPFVYLKIYVIIIWLYKYNEIIREGLLYMSIQNNRRLDLNESINV